MAYLSSFLSTFLSIRAVCFIFVFLLAFYCLSIVLHLLFRFCFSSFCLLFCNSAFCLLHFPYLHLTLRFLLLAAVIVSTYIYVFPSSVLFSWRRLSHCLPCGQAQ